MRPRPITLTAERGEVYLVGKVFLKVGHHFLVTGAVLIDLSQDTLDPLLQLIDSCAENDMNGKKSNVFIFCTIMKYCKRKSYHRLLIPIVLVSY